LKNSRRLANACFAIALLLLSACVTSTQATRLQKDLDDVKRQVFQVQQDTAGSRAQIDDLSKRLTGSAPNGGQGELQEAIRGLLDQIQTLGQRLDEMKTRMSSLSMEIQALRTPGSRTAPPQDSGSASPSAVPRGSQSNEPADQAFKTAYADYSKGNYDMAVTGFGDFLKSWPAHPLSADAQYWIGECLYSEGKYKESMEAMDRTVRQYPGSEKVPAALLKKGYAQIESGQTSGAVATLQSLMEKYPQTDEARLASERMRQLGLRAR
jgi:tol-pal system protein YbgF